MPTIALLFYFSDDLAQMLFQEAQHGDLFRLTVVVSALTALSLQPLALLRAQEKAFTYSALQLVRGVAGPGTIFLLLVVFRSGIRGILWGEIIGLSILTAAGMAVTWRWLQPAFDVKKLKPLLAFGLPLLPMGIGGALLTVSDRYILRGSLSLEEMAPYSLGFRIGMALSLLIQALQLSWIPAAFNLAKTGNRASIAKSVLALQLLLFGMAMATAAAAPELVRLFAPGAVFAGAHYIIPWIAFSFAMHGVVTLLGAAFGIAKRTMWSSFVFCTAGAVKVALSLLVIPRYGIAGATVTTFVTFALELGLAYFIAQRVYPLPFDGKRFWGAYALSAAGFAGVLLSFSLPQPYSLAARILLLSGFCAASYAFILTRADRRAVWEAAAVRWARFQKRLARRPKA
jgi:O-antigen/teichoic acid export membrane protein